MQAIYVFCIEPIYLLLFFLDIRYKSLYKANKRCVIKNYFMNDVNNFKL